MAPPKKVSDEVLLESYGRLGNIWKVAEEVGLCGQSVHERIVRLGIENPDKWTESDIALLTRFYVERRLAPKDKFNLEDLAKQLNRDKANVCRKARQLGLTNQKRLLSEERSLAISERAKKWISENGHPRGMLGKHHSEETRNRMSELTKTLWASKCACFIDGTSTFRGLQTKHVKGTLITPRQNVSWKGGNRNVGGVDIYFRSAWEANYGRYLELMKSHKLIFKWEHEPETFWFHGIQRGCRMFIPDFKVWFNEEEFAYFEVKGWMDQRSKTKLERMSRYYPEHAVVVVDKNDLDEIEHIFGPRIEGWELPSGKKSFAGFRNGKITAKWKLKKLKNKEAV